MKLKFHLNSALLFIFILSACTHKSRISEKKVYQPVKNTVSTTTHQHKTKKAKNVILLIGDGMGPQQIGLLLSYARQATNPVIDSRVTAFDRLLNGNGQLGVSMTYAANTLVTDSAASATQIASGKAAGSEMIGADEMGFTAKSIVEVAQDLNKSTGLISDTKLTHATPASFAAHQAHRTMENDIALDLINSNVDVMLSGGLRYFVPNDANNPDSENYQEVKNMVNGAFDFSSNRNDDKNLLKLAQQKGYKLAFTKTEMEQADDKLLGLFANYPMADAIKVLNGKNDKQPTLKEMSEKAIQTLSKNDAGFFLMIESGQIDWASHGNDTGMLLHEMLKINETLNYLLDWVSQRDDTLLIVTADHETGGFGFSYSANDLPSSQPLKGDVFDEKAEFKPHFNFGNTKILDKLYQQKLTYRDIFIEFDAQIINDYKNGDRSYDHSLASKLATKINENTSFKISDAQAGRILMKEYNPFLTQNHKELSDDMVPKMNANDAFFVYQKDNRSNLLAIEVALQQNVVWATGTHTSTPVLIFALGPNQEAFGKIMHHTHIHSKIKEAWSE